MSQKTSYNTTMMMLVRCFAYFSLLACCNGLATRLSKRATTGTGFGESKTLNYDLDESASTQALCRWLESQHADLGRAAIGFQKTTQQSRGLFATKTIAKDKIICKIPSDCALALSDPNNSNDQTLTIAQNAVNFLNMYSNNKDAKKVWKPYLDSLPTTPDKTPDFYADDEIDLLEFPRLVRMVQARKVELQTLSQTHDIDYHQLQYAAWLVSSRSFPISLAVNVTATSDTTDETDDDASMSQQQGPILDMANYKAESNAQLTLIDPEKDNAWFAFKATRPIAPGTEICIPYGADSSVELLANYGFVPSKNPVDALMLRKRGDDCLAHPSDLTTTLEEDQAMLQLCNDPTLATILAFRIRLKESYETTK
jgi:hypothetical protein